VNSKRKRIRLILDLRLGFLVILIRFVIRVYLRLSRSNVRFPGVSRTINHRSWPRSNVSYSGVLRTIIHQELADVIGTGLADVIGTGFICSSILVSLGVLAVQYS